MVANVVQVGPWGGEGGISPWEFTTNGGRISSVTLSLHPTPAVASLQFAFTKDNKTNHSTVFGTLTDKTETYTFADDEDLIEVSGLIGIWLGITVVVSLTFKTNKKVYGPFGNENGSPFKLPVIKGKFEGFFGNSGVVIDSIGAVIVP